MVNLLRGIFGVCVVNSLMFAALIGILTARRRRPGPPKTSGGLTVTRRGGRTYIVIANGAPKPGREPYDWAKESVEAVTEAPETVTAAD